MKPKDEPRFVLTRKDGKDTLHRNPGEQCNLDDTLADQKVDEFTAEAMLLRGDARPCAHCIGEGWG